MIDKDMSITDIVMEHPEVLPVFREYGLGCIGCLAARFETLGRELRFTALTWISWWTI